MKTNTVSFAHFGNEKSLRNDCVYQRMIAKNCECANDDYRFADLFTTSEIKVSSDDLADDFLYCQIGDVDKGGTPHPVTLNFDIRDLQDEDYYKKIEKGDIMAVNQNDILISFLLPQDDTILGKFIRIDETSKDVFFSRAFLRIVPRKHPEILYYYLRTAYYKRLVAYARIRKGYTGYSTLSSNDLSSLRFSRADIEKLFASAASLTDSIRSIEQAIRDKEQTILNDQSIINSVFQREFGFDYDRFEELKTHKQYISKQALFSNNPDLRFSAKYHRPAGDFVREQLTAITKKKIKHCLAEPIALGASISPADFDDSGSAYYVSVATIKTLEVELDDTQLVSDAYYSAHRNKSLKPNDIIVARSGVAIGKVAIVTEEFDGVFADFTMRVRLDEKKCNPVFAYYYFRTAYFQYLIEVYKKGLQNQNIFPIVIQEFPVPDISLMDQQRIVDEIQSEIQKQNQIKTEIAELRKQIDDIILGTGTVPEIV